ncbi:hypothetical protein ACTFIU_001981 [Dictyostelium citrinum]
MPPNKKRNNNLNNNNNNNSENIQQVVGKRVRKSIHDLETILEPTRRQSSTNKEKPTTLEKPNNELPFKENSNINNDLSFKNEDIINYEYLNNCNRGRLEYIAETIGIPQTIVEKSDKNGLIQKTIQIGHSRIQFLNQQEQNSKNNYNNNNNNNNNNKNNNNNNNIEKDINETLFWNVWRNIVVNYSIFSNFSPHLSIKYESIINVDKMIRNNQLSMIKDKVKRNQYLIFNNDSLKQLYSLFGKEENQYENNNNNSNNNNEFFYNLFKNYGDRYIIGWKSNEKSELIKSLIENNSVVGISTLINKFQFEININESVIFAITIGCSLKLFKYLLELFLLKINNMDFILSQFLSTSPISKKALIKTYKMILYIIEKEIIDLKPHKDQIFKTITPLCPLASSFRLKDLIEAIKIINWFNNNNNSNNSTIINNEFSMAQLNSKLIDPINFNNETNKFNIKELLNIYYNNRKTLDVSSKQFFSYYYDDNNNNDSNYQDNKKNTQGYTLFGKFLNPIDSQISDIEFNFIQAIQNANSHIFSSWLYNFTNRYDLELFKQVLNQNQLLKNEKSILFSNNKIKKEDQIKFLISSTSVIKEIIKMNENSNFNTSYMESNILFLFLIKHDSIELLKHFSDQFSKEEKEIVFCFTQKTDDGDDEILDFNICKYINSNEMLDFLYNEYHHLFIHSKYAYYLNFKNLNLLKHFEKLIDSSSRKPQQQQQGQPIINYKQILHLTNFQGSFKLNFETFKHVVENPSIYYYELKILSPIITDLYQGNNLNEVICLFKYIFRTNYFNNDMKLRMLQLSNYFLESEEKPILLSKFFEWLYVNKHFTPPKDVPFLKRSNFGPGFASSTSSSSSGGSGSRNSLFGDPFFSSSSGGSGSSNNRFSGSSSVSNLPRSQGFGGSASSSVRVSASSVSSNSPSDILKNLPDIIGFYYLSGRLNEIDDEIFNFKNTYIGGKVMFTSNLYKLSYFIGKRGDLNTLSTVIARATNNLQPFPNPIVPEYNSEFTCIRGFIYSILEIAAKNGQLQIFQYFQYHHCQVLKQDHFEWFEKEKLLNLFVISLRNDHIEIAQLLLSHIYVSKKKFKNFYNDNDCNTKISHNYFINLIK